MSYSISERVQQCGFFLCTVSRVRLVYKDKGQGISKWKKYQEKPGLDELELLKFAHVANESKS